MKLTALSLFSGAGGMDLGLEQAGFDSVGAIEIGGIQRESIHLNRDWELIGSGDVNELSHSLTPESLGLGRGELDLIAGGPPCQPFSMAAQWARRGRQGMLDPRAETVLSTLRLIERFLPRAVLLENVAGFVRGPGAALQYLEDEIAALGKRCGVIYRPYVSVVNAADYGVPQNRRRAIVIFMRDEVPFDWPAPNHADSPRTAWDALYDLTTSSAPEVTGKWGELLPSIPPGENYQWLTARGGGPELFGYRTRYWNFLLKLAPWLPSWTLSASPGPATGPFHWGNRPLTVSEQLRLQSFPDGWRLAGDSRAQVLQVGNATPPLLAEVLGRALKRSLTGGSDIELPRLLRAPAPTAPPPSPKPAPLPPQFDRLVGQQPAHKGAGLGPAPRLAFAAG